MLGPPLLCDQLLAADREHELAAKGPVVGLAPDSAERMSSALSGNFFARSKRFLRSITATQGLCS